MPRQPRQAMLFGDTRQLRDNWRGQGAGAAHIDIETVVGGSDLDIKRLAGRDQRLGERPGCIDRSAQGRIEKGAAIDRNDVVRTRGSEADLNHLAATHARMKRKTAAAASMCVDK